MGWMAGEHKSELYSLRTFICLESVTISSVVVASAEGVVMGGVGYTNLKSTH